jgi:hypothetical protein
VVIDYFAKSVEAMTTIKSDGKIATFLVFNQIITRFSIPTDIVTDHGSHFQNEMMEELGDKLVFKHGHSSPYYPQANGQVENKSLKTILQKNVSQSKYDPFQLVNGVESILPIECEIPSLTITINKMQVKHYNHSSKGRIVEIHLHLPNIHQAKP